MDSLLGLPNTPALGGGGGGGGSYLRNYFCLTRCKVLIRNQNILSVWASQRTKESSAVYDNITDFVTP